jgi:hypothetical protein
MVCCTVGLLAHVDSWWCCDRLGVLIDKMTPQCCAGSNLSSSSSFFLYPRPLIPILSCSPLLSSSLPVSLKAHTPVPTLFLRSQYLTCPSFFFPFSHPRLSIVVVTFSPPPPLVSSLPPPCSISLHSDLILIPCSLFSPFLPSCHCLILLRLLSW